MSKGTIGVIAKGYLGDMIMALPLLKALSELDSKVVVAAPDPAAHIAKQVPGVSVFTLHGHKRQLSQSYRQFFAIEKPETVILLNRSWRSAWVAKLGGVRTRIGHKVEWRSALLSQGCKYDWQQYEAESYFELGKFVEISNEMPSISLPYAHVSNESGPYAIIQPGARYEEKTIKISHLLRAADLCHASGMRVVLVGKAPEASAASRLMANASYQVTNLVGQTDLDDLQGLLAGASIVIGSDTGVTHFSVALGTPTVMVFGPNSVKKWGHVADHVINVVSPTGSMDNVSLSDLEHAIIRLLDKFKVESRLAKTILM